MSRFTGIPDNYSMVWFTILIRFFLLAQISDEVTVAVAANFLLPMQEVQELYEDKYGKRIRLIAASSGVLTAQIKNGAPFDIFMSADMKYPQVLYEEGYSIQKPDILVNGQLVLWFKDAAPGIDAAGLLSEPSVKAIAIAQPELAPYGANAKEWLEQHNLFQKNQKKLVYGENVGKVNQYIFSGSVDAAFTSNSAMYSDQLKNKGKWFLLNDFENAIPHGMVLVQNRRGVRPNPEVLSFYDFLFDPEVQVLFEKYGYLPPF